MLIDARAMIAVHDDDGIFPIARLTQRHEHTLNERFRTGALRNVLLVAFASLLGRVFGAPSASAASHPAIEFGP